MGDYNLKTARVQIGGRNWSGVGRAPIVYQTDTPFIMTPLPPGYLETPFINGGKVFAAVVSAWDDDGTQVGGRTSWVALLLCQSEL